MLIEFVDFNHADALFASTFKTHWKEVSRVLEKRPLHLKASDQAGIQGTAIWDPVGSNEHIKSAICRIAGWRANIVIPAEFRFLGTDVDFGKGGVLVEVQFSNYPFLLNNTVRAELFFKSKVLLTGEPIEVVIIVAKAKMFPASNSTLYFEQAKNQLALLAKNSVFDIPMRLVGLFERPDTTVPVRYTTYAATRYSRTVVERPKKRCRIQSPNTPQGRCTLTVIGT
jgi:hypothetical protein